MAGWWALIGRQGHSDLLARPLFRSGRAFFFEPSMTRGGGVHSWQRGIYLMWSKVILGASLVAIAIWFSAFAFMAYWAASWTD